MSILSGDVTLPKIGKVPKIAVAGGVSVVAIFVVIYYRNRKATAAATATDPAAVADTSYQPGIDSSGGSSSGDTSTADQVVNGPPFSTNAAWAQYVTTYLVDTLNMDAGTVAADIGQYLAGDQVTQAVKQVIDQMTAYAGQPPVAGPNGYPPSINVSGTLSGTGSAPGAVTLAQGAATTSSVAVTWTPVTGATGYAWTATGDGYSKSGSTSSSSITLSGLKAATTYTVTVHATNSSGSGPDSSIVVRTSLVSGGTPLPGGGGTAATGYIPVTVVKFTTKNPPWNSTLSGIAEHYGYGGDWQTIWNDSKNAVLRTKRGNDPSNIQAGDVVQVKKK